MAAAAAQLKPGLDGIAVHRLGGSPCGVWPKPWTDEMLYVFKDRKQERLRLEVRTGNSRIVSVTRETYPAWTTDAVFGVYTREAFPEAFGPPTREGAGQLHGRPIRVWTDEDPAVSRALLRVEYYEEGDLASIGLYRMPEPGAPRRRARCSSTARMAPSMACST